MMPEELRNPTDAGNAVSTFVNHPDLTRSYLSFSFYLLTRSTLPHGCVSWPYYESHTSPDAHTSGASIW